MPRPPFRKHNGSKSLPTIKTKELERVFSKLGFIRDDNHHRHIKFTKGEKELILKKGKKDIDPHLFKKIIKDISEKTKKTEQEVIEFILKNK